MNLNKEQQKALNLLNSDKNIFLTGAAGTGKSYVLNKYLENCNKRVAILSSTGISAMLINGRTIHSFFGIGIMQGGIENTINRVVNNKFTVMRISRVNTIIIDEISMVTSEVFKCIEKICREIGNKKLPWGGKRIIVTGDFYQLPPINKKVEHKDWCFMSKTWSKSNFTSIILNKVMRTNDEKFLNILKLIRSGNVNNEVSNYIKNKITDISDIGDDVIRIFPRRDMVERYNNICLNEINSKLYTFKTKYEVTFKTKSKKQMFIYEKYSKAIVDNSPIPPELKIKVGARVMIRANDKDGNYVNGSTGEVLSINNQSVDVKLDNGNIVRVEEIKFSMLNGDGDEVAYSSNIPLTLAYAITIHKSQGISLNKAYININNLWDSGQAYVAMSRLTSGEGLYVQDWDKPSIKVNDDVIKFYSELRRYFEKDINC